MNSEPNARQVWFADDATAAGRLLTLRLVAACSNDQGPDFGYKTHLIVKPELANEANRIFDNTNVQISTNGQRHLGAAIRFIEAYAAQKIVKWVNEI